MYVNKCIKCGVEFETKNPKRVICPNCLYPDKKSDDNGGSSNGQGNEQQPKDNENGSENKEHLQGYSTESSFGGGYSAGGYSPRERQDRPSYDRGQGGYQSRGGYQDRNQGGYQSRGGYQDRSQGGYQSRGGYQDRSQGGYQDRNQGGGYQDRSQGGYQARGGYGDRRPQSGGYQDRNQGGGYQDRNQGGYQSRGTYGDRRPQSGGYQDRSQGGYQSRGGYQDRNQGGGYQDRSQGGYQARGGYGDRRPQAGGRPSFGGGRPPQRRPMGRPALRPQKQLLVSKEQLEQIEALYKTMLPLPNPDAHEVIGEKIGLEARKVFFGINLIRQKMMLPKLPFPKRKLAISPDQLLAIRSLYEPLLPLPPIGCHKIIAIQLKIDEWRVHVGIGLIRAQMGLERWNQEREDAPDEFKKQVEEKPKKATKTSKTKKVKEESEDEPKPEKKTRAKKAKKSEDETEE